MLYNIIYIPIVKMHLQIILISLETSFLENILYIVDESLFISFNKYEINYDI